MKLLKLLNKKNLSILISFFFLQNSYSIEPVDIWNLEKQPNQDNSKNEIVENENLLPSTIFNIQNKIKKEVSVDEEENFLSNNINIAGVYAQTGETERGRIINEMLEENILQL